MPVFFILSMMEHAKGLSARDVAGRLGSRFGALCFEAEGHKYYFNDDDCALISATSFVHSLQPPFEADSVAGMTAFRQGRAKSEILEEWAFKNDFSKALGSWIHKIMEIGIRDFMAGSETDYSQFMDDIPKAGRKRALKTAGNAVRLMESVLEDWEPAGIEFKVFDLDCRLGKDEEGRDRRLAGTVDALLRSRKTGEFQIFDWKTSEKLRSKGFGKKMLKPFKDLESCNVNEYRLQLSLYKEVLERSGICEIAGLKLGHVTDSGWNLADIEAIPLKGRIDGWD